MWNFKSEYGNANTLARDNFLNGQGDFLRKQPHIAIQIIFNIKEIINLLFRNDKCMTFCQWIDIEESQESVIFCYFVTGDFSIDDTGKNSRHGIMFLGT